MDLFGQRADANAIRGCRPTSTREFDSSCSLQRAVDVAASLLMTTAGHTVVYFVMGQMVGDRRFPGATTLGSRSCTPSANHPVSVPPTGPVHRDGSFFPYIVTGSSVFWDFGSLHLETSRRPTGQLLRQRHTQRKTFRRPRPTVAAAASPASTTFRRQRTEASVENGVSLIDRFQGSVVETFIWKLARMKSRLCPCSLFLRQRDAQQSADKVHRAF